MNPERSAEEVADKLWEDCAGACKAQALPVIAKTLTAYANERVKEAKLEERYFWQQFIKEKAFKISTVETIRAEALEEAAKEVETHLGRKCTLVCHCAANARQIRALKSSP